MYLGIDIGTSGVRIVAIDAKGETRAQVARPFGCAAHDPKTWPKTWRKTLELALSALFAQVPADGVKSLAVDGTSGTLLAVDENGTPLATPLMYNGTVADPATLAALEVRGWRSLAPTAAGRAFHLNRIAPAARLVHQADWIAGLFSGRFDVSDDNNALKTGFDPETRSWKGPAADSPLCACLPQEIMPPGTPLGRARGVLAQAFGMPPSAQVVAGTTDGCASFLASGAESEGDGVTALGSTLTLKLLSARRIEDPASGVYSHRLLDRWLVGGASNSGGRVLAQHFTAEQITRLGETQAVDPPTGLAYYPLPKAGERFPINDPDLVPCLSPRPASDAVFFKAMLEGMATIEAAGYDRLAALGGPALRRLFTVGGGAANPLWREIRARRLGLVPQVPRSTEAAFGSARLARLGVR